jgi:anti-sigma regulatory factor (Ser/Thr protein kinase)
VWPSTPLRKEKADTSLSAEDRQVGGMGILLMRELMDVINYERENGKNILTLIKNI